MNEIMVKGTQEFMGIAIPVVYGGFGKGQRCVSAKTVARIHESTMKVINQSINRLISQSRMRDTIDYIDMFSNEELKVTASDLGFINSNGQKNCYILSERGYMKLIKYMDDDTSWDVMENFIDEYFRMKEHIEVSSSPTLTQDDFKSIISYMEEQEQKRFDMMMSTFGRLEKVFDHFEISMTNLANVVLVQNKPQVSVTEMVESVNSNYTEKGKAYRDEIIDLCKQIVALSEFKDEKAVLSACYKHLTKNYGIVWEQEIREWKEQHAYVGKVSPLNVISESDDGKYLKSMVRNILLGILDDCKKQVVASNTETENISEDNHEACNSETTEDTTDDKQNEIHILTVAANWDEANQLVEVIANKMGDKSPYRSVTYNRVYKVMEDMVQINWYNFTYTYKRKHNLPNSAKVFKKRIIAGSPKLQKWFIDAVNKMMEDINNAE